MTEPPNTGVFADGNATTDSKADLEPEKRQQSAYLVEAPDGEFGFGLRISSLPDLSTGPDNNLEDGAAGMFLMPQIFLLLDHVFCLREIMHVAAAGHYC